MEKLTISRPIIVEGKYDKIKLDSLLSAYIIPTDGFALFKKTEKKALLRRLAKEKGVIVLTDADGGGKQIRTFLSELLPKDKVIHLHTPAIQGKERRKEKAGKAGLLGVEGIDADTLRALFAPFADGAPAHPCGGITKLDFYNDGLSGKEGATEKRAALALSLGLPPDLTANTLLDAINLLVTKEEYRAALERIQER